MTRSVSCILSPRDRWQVLDASALAELARRRPAAFGWLRTARVLGIALYLLAFALAGVRAVRPDAAPLLADLLTHPSVLVGELDAAMVEQVEQLFLEANAFDALAGHVIHVARQRRWPVLTADPGRLHLSIPLSTSTCCGSSSPTTDARNVMATPRAGRQRSRHRVLGLEPTWTINVASAESPLSVVHVDRSLFWLYPGSPPGSL